MKWIGAALAGIVVVGAVLAVGLLDAEDDAAPGPGRATATSAPPVGELPARPVPPADASCDRLRAAGQDATVRLVDAAFGAAAEGGAGGCVVVGTTAPGVTVTGTFTGDLQCHGCDGWTFEGVTTEAGSLRMIGGADWRVTGARLHGGNRGLMAVLGTGSTDSPEVVHRSPRRWVIEDTTAEGAGCRPPGDPLPTHVRALYVIGANGVDNEGVVRGSVFRGQPCGAVVKIGSTANFGVHERSPDAADGVTFEDNTVVVEGPLPEGVPHEPLPVLVAGHSDDVRLVGNSLDAAGRWAVSATGPFTGRGFVVEGNEVTTENLALWRRWRRGRAEVDAYLSGEEFVTFTDDPCPDLGECAGNAVG